MSLKSYGYPEEFRCDAFTDSHNGLHVLFGGCSITCGQHLDMEDTWAYRVYSNIKSKHSISGYFNVAVPGFSTTDIIVQCFKYFEQYGNPDIIFLLLPNVGRDFKYFNSDNVTIDDYLTHQYALLEKYCIKHEIKLFSFTWASPEINAAADSLTGKGMGWRDQIWSDEPVTRILGQFSSFYDLNMTKKQLMKELFKHYELVGQDPLSLLARDSNHPGKVWHSLWKDFVLNNIQI